MKIKVTKNGPYEVTGNVPIFDEVIVADSDGKSEKWEKGKEYSTGNTVMLCRCGHSNNKPYCDGEHAKINFVPLVEGKALDFNSYDDAAETLVGPKVTLMDQENLCAVAGFCDRGESAWNYAVSDNDKDIEIAIEQCCNCPSGRLTIVKDGIKIEPDLNKEIGVIQDKPANKKGPLWIKGGIDIEDVNGDLYHNRNRVTLCRCGESSNMPFCDASHMGAKHMNGIDV